MLIPVMYIVAVFPVSFISPIRMAKWPVIFHWSTLKRNEPLYAFICQNLTHSKPCHNIIRWYFVYSYAFFLTVTVYLN